MPSDGLYVYAAFGDDGDLYVADYRLIGLYPSKDEADAALADDGGERGYVDVHWLELPKEEP